MTDDHLLDLIARATSGEALLASLGASCVALWDIAPRVPPEDLPVLLEALAACASSAPADPGHLLDRWVDDGALEDGLLPGWSEEVDQLALALHARAHPWSASLAPGASLEGRLLVAARCTGRWPDLPAASCLLALAGRLLDGRLPSRLPWPALLERELHLDGAAGLHPLHEAMTGLVGPAWGEALYEACLRREPRQTAWALAPAWAGRPVAEATGILLRTLPDPRTLDAVRALIEARSTADLVQIATDLADHDPDLAELCAAEAFARAPRPELLPLLRGLAWSTDAGRSALGDRLAHLPQADLRAVLGRTLAEQDGEPALAFVPLLDHPDAAPHALRWLSQLADRPPRGRSRAVHALSAWVPARLDTLVRRWDEHADPVAREVISRAVLRGLDAMAGRGEALPAGADHLLDLHLLDLDGPDDPILHEEVLPALRRLARALPAGRARALLNDQLDPTRPTAARALWLIPDEASPAWVDAAAEALLAHPDQIAALSPGPLRAWLARHEAALTEALPEALTLAPETARHALFPHLPWTLLLRLSPPPTEPVAALRHLARLAAAQSPNEPTIVVSVVAARALPIDLRPPAGQPGPPARLDRQDGRLCWLPAPPGATPASPQPIELPLNAVHPGPDAASPPDLLAALDAIGLALGETARTSWVSGATFGHTGERLALPWPPPWA